MAQRPRPPHTDAGALSGVIAMGAVADCVAVDREPFVGLAASIYSTRTVASWIAGRRVIG